jgi:hypothetical protein
MRISKKRLIKTVEYLNIIFNLNLFISIYDGIEVRIYNGEVKPENINVFNSNKEAFEYLANLEYKLRGLI